MINPKLFLLDEPLSNLDAKLRAEVRIEIRALQQRLGLTTLLVTHDREEALTMADRLVVMEGGRVRQIGSPRELYDEPQDAFVADFVGRCNILPGRRENDTQFRTASGLLLSVDTAANESNNATAFALRPERISISPGASGDIHGRVEAVTYLGAQTEYHVRIGKELFVVVRQTPGANEPLAALKPQDMVSLQWEPNGSTTRSRKHPQGEIIMISRRHFLSASAGAATMLASNVPIAQRGIGPGRGRHLGRRLWTIAQRPHRQAAARAEGHRGAAGRRQRRSAEDETAGRAAKPARVDGRRLSLRQRPLYRGGH